MAKPIQISPASGGQLLSAMSADKIGISNWRVKRDFRYDDGDDIRAEGHVPFWANTSKDIGQQPYPKPDRDEPITLLAMLRRPNGETALIAGTPTRLYRYFSFSSGRYVLPTEVFYYFEPTGPNTPVIDDQGPGSPYLNEGDQNLEYFSTNPADYPDGVAQYVDENPGEWLLIGSGFSGAGHRWEHVQIGGTMVFNNGVDIPVTYRLEEFQVTPIHELRELGVARVGTIAGYSGVLMLGDISMIRADDIAPWMNGATPYGPYDGSVDRYQFRAMWSMVNSPRRFAVPITCRTTRGSRELHLDFPIQSIQGGSDVLVVGAGPDGANLRAAVVQNGGLVLYLDQDCSTDQQDTQVILFDAFGSLVGYHDLEDDGSAIMRMLELQGLLVIYKETAIFLARYVGTTETPFEWEKVDPPQSQQSIRSRFLYYRHTLIDVQGRLHIYAGESSFYRFDLVDRFPQEIMIAERCKDTFFRAATRDLDDHLFAVDNAITKEIWICFPFGDEEDRMIRYDYQNGRLSTSSAVYTAGATIIRPEASASVVAYQQWFVAGTRDGTVVRYGLINRKPQLGGTARLKIFANLAITTEAFFTREHVGNTIVLASGRRAAISGYVNATTVQLHGTNAHHPEDQFSIEWSCHHRDGATYPSVLESGLEAFGDPYNDKILTGYVPVISSKSPNTPFTISLLTAQNPTESPRVAGSRRIVDRNRNNVPAGLRGIYLADRIQVEALFGLRVAARIFNVDGVRSRSVAR